MINEPIRFKIEDNKISLEDGYVGEMMELNEYPIEIGTNEYLDGCRAIVKKYGEQELEELGEFSCKLERLVVIKKDDEYWWGKLSYYKGEKDPLLHRASLFKYHPIEEQSEFPEIQWNNKNT